MKKSLILSLLFSNICLAQANQATNNSEHTSQPASNSQTNKKNRSFFDPFFEEIEQMRHDVESLHKLKMERLEKELLSNTKKQKLQAIDNFNLNIEQNQTQLIIKLNIENLLANELQDFDIKNNTILGTIPTEHGIVNLAITPNYIEVAQRAKIKSTDNKGEEKSYVSQYVSSQQATTLPAVVDINSAKAELHNNNLIITINKKTGQKLSIIKYSEKTSQKSQQKQKFNTTNTNTVNLK